MVLSETRFFFSKPRTTYSFINKLTKSTIFCLLAPLILTLATEAIFEMGPTEKLLICLTNEE